MSRRDELVARVELLESRLHRRLEGGEPDRVLIDAFGSVTMHQLSAVQHLVEHGPLTMHQLATGLAISASSATEMVDRLAQHGLVERAADSADRRIQRVLATPTAVAAVKTVRASRRRHLATMMDPLSNEELGTFISLAERMVDGSPGDPTLPRVVPPP